MLASQAPHTDIPTAFHNDYYMTCSKANNIGLANTLHYPSAIYINA